MSRDGRASEQLVERWLRARGLTPARFALRRRRLGKTPDFRVATPAGESFFVEVKTLNNASPGHGAVALKLMRANAQFAAVNQGGHVANVLALVTPIPDALSGPVANLAAADAPPLRGLDLVLGFAPTPTLAAVVCLYERPASRHRELLQGPLATGTALAPTGALVTAGPLGQTG